MRTELAAVLAALVLAQGAAAEETAAPNEAVKFGAELIIPVNRLSGHGIGGVAQFHIYLDDIFPRSIGKPLFGGY